MKEGDLLSLHVIKIVGYLQSLDRYGFPVSKEDATNIIPNSLHSDFGMFILNYHMHGMDKELTKLHRMLMTGEAGIKKGTGQVLMVHSCMIKKGSWSKKKVKSKGGNMADVSPSAASVSKPSKSPGTVCFYYKKEVQWKRNCNKYMTNKTNGGSIDFQ